ncbi:MAG: TetR/AcrR family transcriptional regulator [Treponema sp.]|jgi:AcrR family transcriptional regulator|nr:TetR/AcrR family transcriptional regulator [Treponema sp.]
MSILIEHDKRRSEILERAVDVFVEEGFENTTFQKIADRCDITRTTLYIYFRNKREIFNYSIKQLMNTVETDIVSIKEDQSKNCVERLALVFSVIIDRLVENRRLLSVILDYLWYYAKSLGSAEKTVDSGEKEKKGASPEKKVHRRTIRIRHILAGIIIQGIESGELPRNSVGYMGKLLYALLESAVFRLSVLETASLEDLKRSARLMIYSQGKSPPSIAQSTY